MKKYLGVLLFCAAVNSAHAAGANLAAVYQQALRCDPTLAKAQATSASVQEGVPQNRAGLLPTLSSGANVQDTRNSDQSPSSAPLEELIPGLTGNQHSYGLTLTQPIFNFQTWMQLRAAKDSAKQADATYNAALQDLIIRVSTAYFNVLQAQDTLRFTQAQKKAVQDQLQQIKERYQVGMATMTDVYQAQANYDGLNAKEISAQNAVMNNFDALRQITGQTYSSLSPLKPQFPLVTPYPADARQWIQAGERNNWTLLAAHYGELAAKENIRVNYAGHFPTVDATGKYLRGNSAALGLVNETANGWSSTVGVQLNLPLFQGGLVMSKTRQAQDDYLASSDQMEITHRQVIFQTQQSFNNVMSGVSKIEADRRAITSAKSALDSTNEGYKAGTKTILDVLTSEQNLYQAQAALSADQYQYILDTLGLKQAAGSLNAQDVIAINRLLQTLT